MPIYEYQCDGCQAVFEVRQRMTDPAPTGHACGSTSVHRILSATSFVLKGTGWYATDYGNRSAPPAEGGEGKSEGKAEGKDNATGDAKADKKGEAKADSKGDAKQGSGARAGEGGAAKPGGGDKAPAKGSAAPAQGSSPRGGGSPAAA